MHITALYGLVAVSVVVALSFASGAVADTRTENVYVAGQTYEINTGAAIVFDASRGLLEDATPFYIIGFPVAPGTTGPITLPSGYQPQHNGFPPSPIPYHDHVLAGAPGFGTSGTADDYNATFRVVQMRYGWAYAYSPAFVPITSVDQIPAGEAAGWLDVINAGAPDPHQIWTTTVLIRPIISKGS